MLGLFTGINKYLGIALVALAIAFGVYFWYSQSKIASLNSKITAQDIALQENAIIIDNLKVDVEKIKNVNKKLSQVERDAVENVAKLTEKLRDLEEIATKKPVIVQDLVNQASKDRIRCFQLATGANKNKDEVNKSCPHLLKN